MSTYTAALPTLLGAEIVDEDKWDDILDALAALYDTPGSYTPTWTGTTGTPSVGNGTLTGLYGQLGKLVFLKIVLIFGSTTNDAGIGTWRFALPVNPVTDQIIPALANNSGGGGLRYGGAAWIISTSATGDNMRIVFSGESGFGSVTPTSPWTWTNTDRLILEGWFTAS